MAKNSFKRILRHYVYSMRAFALMAETAQSFDTTRYLERRFEAEPQFDANELSDTEAAQLHECTSRFVGWMVSVFEQADAARHEPGWDPRVPDMPEELTAHYDSLPLRVRDAFTSAAALWAEGGPSMFNRSLMERSVLIGLVSDFEVLVSEVCHAYLERVPAALPKESTLTLGTLRTFGSLEEVWEHVRDREANSLLREGLHAWARYFERRMHIDLRQLAHDWDRFAEHFQRRHLFVHRGGEISREYLSVTPEHVRAKLKVPIRPGANIGINADYLRDALYAFETTGYLLLMACWRKLAGKNDLKWMRAALDLTDQALRERRWSVALRLATPIVEMDGEGSLMAYRSGLAALLAIKHTGGLSEEDVATCNELAALELIDEERIRLACVRGDFDEFVRVLEESGGEALEEEDWTLDPFVREFHAHERFAAARERFQSHGGSQWGEEDYDADSPNARLRGSSRFPILHVPPLSGQQSVCRPIPGASCPSGHRLRRLFCLWGAQCAFERRRRRRDDHRSQTGRRIGFPHTPTSLRRWVRCSLALQPRTSSYRVKRMDEWSDIQRQFEELADRLSGSRLDRQWDEGELERWHLAGGVASADRQRFEALASLAGTYLEDFASDLPAEVRGAREPILRWYRAMWYMQGPDEPPLIASITKDGQHVGHMFAGRLNAPARMAANLALRMRSVAAARERALAKKPEPSAPAPTATRWERTSEWVNRQRERHGAAWGVVAFLIAPLVALLTAG